MNNSSIRRILQVSYDMSQGGAETLIMNIYRHIDRNKVQFDFLLHGENKTAYEDEILSLGGRIYRIPRFLGYNKLSYDRNLKRFLTEHREYEIIHDHLMDSATETFRIAKKMGLKTIAHSHIAQYGSSVDSMIRFFFRKNICKVSDYRFACSREAGEWFYRNKADFAILRNGIETERFAFSSSMRKKTRNKLGLADTDFVIGTIGRCVEQKNQRRAVEVFNDFCKENINAKLVIVGEGPLRKHLEQQVKNLGIDDKVVFTGTLTNTNEVYSSFDCFLFPSLYEGLGIVLVEAQANGLPCVISSTIPREVDLIPSLVERVNLNESNKIWVEAMKRMKPMDNRQEAPKLIKEAGYCINDIAKEMENFYLAI